MNPQDSQITFSDLVDMVRNNHEVNTGNKIGYAKAASLVDIAIAPNIESYVTTRVKEAERLGGIYAIKMMKHHAELHGLEDNLFYADHYLGSQETAPDQPLDRETFERIAITTNGKENSNE